MPEKSDDKRMGQWIAEILRALAGSPQLEFSVGRAASSDSGEAAWTLGVASGYLAGLQQAEYKASDGGERLPSGGSVESTQEGLLFSYPSAAGKPPLLCHGRALSVAPVSPSTWCQLAPSIVLTMPSHAVEHRWVPAEKFCKRNIMASAPTRADLWQPLIGFRVLPRSLANPTLWHQL